MKRLFIPIMVMIFSVFYSLLPGSPAQRYVSIAGDPGPAAGIPGESVLRPVPDFGKQPLYFIANQGQVDKRAMFYVKTPGYTLWLTKDGLVVDSIRRSEVKGKNSGRERFKGWGRSWLKRGCPCRNNDSAAKFEREVTYLVFLDASKNTDIAAVDQTSLKVNYFKGSKRSEWRCDIPGYLAVMYQQVYKNIDLKVYGTGEYIEYNWIVKPGGSPADIKFQYRNVKDTHIDQEGNLVIETRLGKFLHKKPLAYQEMSRHQGAARHGSLSDKPGNRQVVDAGFKKMGPNTYGFSIGRYDKGRDLVIDPLVLLYGTYLGGSDEDEAFGIAVDHHGNIYVTGWTSSPDFPTQAYYQDYQGSDDVFVTRIDPDRRGAGSLVYSTFLGGEDQEFGVGIAVDDNGNAYISGCTMSPDFPTWNHYQTYQGSSDTFVARLDTNRAGADSLVYSTYLGGMHFDYCGRIALDDNGHVYVTGCTESSDFPTRNQYQDYQDFFDVFVSRLDTNLGGDSSLVYSTFLGGGDFEQGLGIAADHSGNAYVTGLTYSSGFPTRNRYQECWGWDELAFVTRLDTNLSGDPSLVYSTCVGGACFFEPCNWGFDIAVDDSGNAYVAGGTCCSSFPTKNPCQAYYAGGMDAIVVRFDTGLDGDSSLIYSTFLGGSGYDEGIGMAIDQEGNTFVTGMTSSVNFPYRYQYQQLQGRWDAFVTKIDTHVSGPSGLKYSSCLGGSDWDEGWGLALDGSGNVYVTGITASPDFPTRNHLQVFQGGIDAFAAKLVLGNPPLVKTRAVHSITHNSARCDGEVLSDRGAPVTARGVCWSTAKRPRISDSRTLEGGGTGDFTAFISNLVPNTTYYVRAYAQNLAGTGYGRILQFKTLRNPLISGRVTGHGLGIPGVSLSLSNRGGQAETDPQGNYSHQVEHNWSGTVTPWKAGHLFEPSSRTYETVSSDLSGQDYTAFFIVLTLQASRQTESSWLIKRQYGKIDVDVDNPAKVPVAGYLLLRKEGEQAFQVLASVPVEDLAGNNYSYLDKYLETSKSYTYKFAALDWNWLIIAASGEVTI